MTENRINGRDYDKTKDSLHAVLVTIYGLTPNLHAGSIYATITMDDLFAK